MQRRSGACERPMRTHRRENHAAPLQTVPQNGDARALHLRKKAMSLFGAALRCAGGGIAPAGDAHGKMFT